MSRSDTVLISVGGGELNEADSVLDEIFRLANRADDPRIVVMTIATSDDEDAASKYNSVFRKRGVRHVETVHIREREDAFNAASLKKIEGADVIYFTGGDQLNITSLSGGTPLHNLLHDRLKSGVVIVGTSAGAAMMSSSMIIEGDSEMAPKKGSVETAPGMDLIDGTIIDTHFSERGRHGRLLAAVAHFPQNIGIGIDERTAIVYQEDGFRVIGEGAVTVMDSSKMTYSDLVYKEHGEPIALFEVSVHVLPADHSFDLSTRSPKPPDRTRSISAG
jgi:cyanophycinase